MRQVGDSMKQAQADRLSAFLVSRGIANTIRDDDGTDVAVWVLNEDRLAEAAVLTADFLRNPTDKSFDAPTPKVVVESEPTRARTVDVRSEVFGGDRFAIPMTMTLIAISLALTLMFMTAGTRDLAHYFFFSEVGGRAFPEIVSGQVWRLVTPIFLHGGVLHLLFNMLWLFQLGGAIERFEGRWYFLAIVLIMSVLINTAQYLVSGPSFLGMSGIVYMLLGYIWMMSRYQTNSQYFLPQQTVSFMIIWLVICLVGIIPGVANTEHVAGLILGVAWGFFRSGQLATLRRRRRYRDRG